MDLVPFSLTGLCLENYFIKISSGTKIIYWIIIGIIVCGIGVLPFIYVDVSVQARGYFQSDIEKQVIYANYQGKVIYSSVHNGARVNKGDTLLIIDSEIIKTQQAALLKAINENRESINDLEKLTEIESFGELKFPVRLLTQRYKAEFENIRIQQAIQLQKYQKKKTEHDRNELLYSQQIIPEIEFENSRFVLSSEKDYLNQILLQQRSSWQSDLALRRNNSIKLLSDYEQCATELSNRIILSPASGEIIQSSDIQTGTIVSPGQLISEISPDGELIATCFVEPADIGLIQENQTVRIQVDAYNYNEWGILPARIFDISDDIIVESGTEAYFRVKCRPVKTYLTLKNGHKAAVKKGMSLNARIVVIRRSVYNLLFDKADKWFNPYTYNKE